MFVEKSFCRVLPLPSFSSSFDIVCSAHPHAKFQQTSSAQPGLGKLLLANPVRGHLRPKPIWSHRTHGKISGMFLWALGSVLLCTHGRHSYAFPNYSALIRFTRYASSPCADNVYSPFDDIDYNHDDVYADAFCGTAEFESIVDYYGDEDYACEDGYTISRLILFMVSMMMMGTSLFLQAQLILIFPLTYASKLLHRSIVVVNLRFLR